MIQTTLMIILTILFMSCSKANEHDKLASECLEKIAAAKYDVLYYSYGSRQLKTELSIAKWRQAMKQCNKFGEAKNKKLLGYKITDLKTHKVAEHVYVVNWKDKNGLFTLRTIQEDNIWKIHGVYYREKTDTNPKIMIK